jgi:hypothetical protein
MLLDTCFPPPGFGPGDGPGDGLGDGLGADTTLNAAEALATFVAIAFDASATNEDPLSERVKTGVV